MDLGFHVRRSCVEQSKSLDVREMRREGLIADRQPSKVIGPTSVRITWLECHFGSERPLWLCPRCDRAAYIIYDRNGVACRRCHGLAYASENMTHHARELKKAFRIRERLGQLEGGVVVSFPQRPKGRHWHTYLRDLTQGPGRRPREAGELTGDIRQGALDKASVKPGS